MTSTMALGGNVPPTQPDFPALPERAPGNVAPTWPDAPALAPPAPAAPVDKRRTMVGVAPAPNAPVPPTPAFSPTPAAKRTMLGIAPPAGVEPPPSMAQPSQQSPSRTLAGIAPDAAPPPAPSAASVSGAAPARPAASKTMLGIAPPPASAAPSAPAPSSEQPLAVPSRLKTKMGLAHPGIVPLHPGVAKAAASVRHAPPTPPPPAAPPVSQSPDLRAEDLAVLPGHGRPKRKFPVAIVLVAAAGLLLLAAAIGIALWWRSGPGIEARVTLDDGARETLEVECADPCRFARVRVGEKSANFASNRASVGLDRALSVGDNEITLELEESDGDKQSVELTVPVAYRLKIDFASLSEVSPRVAVIVEALPETAVVVDGHPVTLDAQGRGRHLIDVSRELTGSAEKVVPLEKRVPYGVTRPKSEPKRGELVLRIGVAPLSVEAPGESIVIDSANFMLAGRTQTGGSVSVSGRPITVDPSGRFAQLMNVSSVGETTIVVRASAADHAPRLFPIRVRRVASLQAEAERFSARATRSYAAIAADSDKKRGLAVAFEGEVVEARTENHTTIVLLDVASGCARGPCLARLMYGARGTIQRGDQVHAYGHVTRAVEGPRSGAKIPELRVDFFLPAKEGRK